MNPQEEPAPRTSLWDKLQTAAENVINLQIVTIIGDVQVSGDIRSLKVDFPDGEPRPEHIVIATNINLVDSDITSVIPKEYAGQTDSQVMKYHAEQVAQANETMTQRVEMIKTLLKDLVPLLSGKNESPSQS